MLRRLFKRAQAPRPTPAVPPSAAVALIDAAARQFLGGDTAGANHTLRDAQRVDPAYFDELSRETAALQRDLAAARATGSLQRFEASDRYTDEHVRVYWNAAKTEFETLSPRENANALVFQIYTEKIGNLVATFQPDAVLDFGCACGLPLFKLATTYPAIQFGGIDRQETLKKLNDEQFAAGNLGFFSGDVLDRIPQFASTQRRKLLIHVRTGIMVYPAFLDRLYATAAANGFRYVALYEIASLSCVSWTFRDQDSGFPSEAHRSTMFLHDYAAALRRAGFRPVQIERMPHGYSLTRNNMLPGDTYVFVLAELA
jgi:hypothetical protein